MATSINRNLTLDLMKALAIFLVVMDHLITNADSVDNTFRTFIYSLHMPLFFIVSGYLASKKQESIRDLVQFFSKKLRLLIPFTVFTVGNVLVLGSPVEGYLGWNKFGMWFLWVLFLFFSVYAITQGVLVKNKNKYVELIVCVVPVLLCLVCRKWQDTTIGGIFNFMNLYNYAFFILGVIIARYKLEDFICREDVTFVLLCGYVLGLATGLPILNIPMKACGILFCYSTFRHLEQKQMGGVIS